MLPLLMSAKVSVASKYFSSTLPLIKELMCTLLKIAKKSKLSPIHINYSGWIKINTR